MNNIIFAFGRMNPMTIGHEHLCKIMHDTGYITKLYLSHKQNPKTDPLDYETKYKWAKKAFDTYVDVVHSDAKTMLYALSEIYNEYGEDTILHIAGGSDRVKDSTENKDKYDELSVARAYNGVEGKPHGYYQFKEIMPLEVKREINEDDIPLVYASGTHQRTLAAENDLEGFKEGCPSTLSDDECEELFEDVREGMKIYEDLEEGYASPNRGLYLKIFKSLRKIITDKLNDNTNKTSIISSSAHYKEVLRIGNNIANGGAYTEEELKIRVEESIKDLLGNKINLSDGTYIILDSMGDYGKHSGDMSSGTFNSYRIDGHYYEDDTELPIDIYISIRSGKNGAKKNFTPNKILDLSQPKILYTNVKNKVNSLGNPELKDLMVEILNEASLDSQVNLYGDLSEGISYLRCEEGSTSPGKILLKLSTPRSAEKFRNLDIDPDVKSALVSTIYTDFSEVIGAVVISNAIAQISTKSVYIEFPTASNEKIIDYFIYNTNDIPIKVSAKKDDGAKASATGVIEVVQKQSQSNDDESRFLNWFMQNHIKVSGTQGHKNVADKMVEIISSLPNTGWEKELASMINSPERLNNLKQAAKDYLELQDHSISPSQETLESLKENINNFLDDLRIKSYINELIPKGKEVNLDNFIRNKAIFCMCKLFVSIMNNTNIILNINQKFTNYFGRFIQVYSKNSNLDRGEFNFEVVFVSMDGTELAVGSKSPTYNLEEDCANSIPNGDMIVKKIAVKLVH